MIEMRGISKRFDAVVALNGASLQVKPGEIRALLGSNGSGKSTMVKILNGLYKATAGQIFIDGKEVHIGSPKDARDLGIAATYQDLSLIPKMSVIDNIVLGLEPCGPLGVVKRKEARAYAIELLEKLQVKCDPDELVQNLMPSTQSMIEVAKALALRPKLLLLDEVTAVLHHDEVETLFGLLRQFKEEGMGIVIVTHRMNEIYQICDTCTILKGGEVAADGVMKEMDLDEVVYHMTGKRPEAAKEQTAAVQKPDTELTLEVRDLVVEPKVKGISLVAHKGEIVGIGGLEGQGQSEYIRTILGTQRHNSGEIFYHGKPVSYKNPAEAMKNNMGFISGDRNKEAMFPLRSVAENIYAAKATKGKLFTWLKPKEIYDYAADAVEKYNIKVGSLSHPGSSLSGGNQQKLVVGRWISVAPDLLFLDDPTKGVDIHSRREIHKILRTCTEQGMTVVIVSSDNEELLDISDRIYVFYEGRVSAILEGEDRTEEKLVAGMMGLTHTANSAKEAE